MRTANNGGKEKERKQTMSHVSMETNTPVAVTQPTASERNSKANKRAREAAPRKDAQKPRRGKKAAQAAQKAVRKGAPKRAGERTNKKAAVVALMRRPAGVTLAEIVAATDWQTHTVRAFVSILGKNGEVTIESFKNSVGERTYKIAK